MRSSSAILLLGVVAVVPGLRLAGIIGPDGSTSGDFRVETAAIPQAEPGATAESTVAPTTAPAADATTTPPPPISAGPPAQAAPSPPVSTLASAPAPARTVAHLREPGIDVYADPAAALPATHLSPTTELGNPRVLLVVGGQGDWLRVLVPVRPNNAVGWIRTGDVDLTTTHDEIRVSLATHTVEWVRDTTVVLRTAVAVGAPASPTPPGSYFVTDVFASSGGYGPFTLALNGHSDTFTEFAGGDARLALHGTDDPRSIGQSVSHGCIRLPNDTIARLAAGVEPGTPVIVS